MSRESLKAIISGTFVKPERPKMPDRQFPIRNDDPTIEFATELHDRMIACAIEFYEQGRQSDKFGKRLTAYDQQACLEAAEMLHKLGLEVQRLRLGIQCHADTGDPDRLALRKMTENWNGDSTGGTQ
jgi:hypothetical protein